ncbi:MAG: ATP-grasp domain-containing protein [Paludibacteraceae bacterium]|nr:ATP-grasp domain-containing protein [Paludibacteraceae bacterium]
MDLSGKKLLVLGSANPAVEIVQYAQSRGAYVIVTDNLPDEKSAAKKVANETAMVNAYDVEAIYELAKEKQVDGIFTGVHEIMLQVMQQVCERLNLPCYFTKEQWDKSQNKANFKLLCAQYDVRTPYDYTNSERIQFPVIVKPVDGCSGTGISIVRSADDLVTAIQVAKQSSGSGTYLVEEYLEGNEYNAVYTIKNGVASLSCVREKFLTQDREDVFSQSEMGLIPHRHTQNFINTIDAKIRNLIVRGLGLQNGCAFFQGIEKNGEFVVFEMGLRMNGAADYINISKLNKINYLEMMVDYSLTGVMGEYDLNLDNPLPDRCTCLLTVFAHEGTISKLGDVDIMKSIPTVERAFYTRPVGFKIEDNSGLYQRVFRAYFLASNIGDLAKGIREVQSMIKVEDENGKNMLFKPFDIKRFWI